MQKGRSLLGLRKTAVLGIPGKMETHLKPNNCSVLGECCMKESWPSSSYSKEVDA